MFAVSYAAARIAVRPRQSFVSSISRSYATRREDKKTRASRGNYIAPKPPYRAPDPLDPSNPSIPSVALGEDLTFIHRPPPSMPSPFSLTVAPSSPLLRPPGEPVSADAPQPPLLRPSSYRPEPPRASDETVAKIRKLRRSDPAYYTCKKLATMFNCTEHFVSRIASLPKPLRKKVVKQTLLEHEKVREGWGEKKFMARAIRQKRREFW